MGWRRPANDRNDVLVAKSSLERWCHRNSLGIFRKAACQLTSSNSTPHTLRLPATETNEILQSAPWAEAIAVQSPGQNDNSYAFVGSCKTMLECVEHQFQPRSWFNVCHWKRIVRLRRVGTSQWSSSHVELLPVAHIPEVIASATSPNQSRAEPSRRCHSHCWASQQVAPGAA